MSAMPGESLAIGAVGAVAAWLPSSGAGVTEFIALDVTGAHKSITPTMSHDSN